MLKVGDTILLDKGQGISVRMTLAHESFYDGKCLHIFQPEGVPRDTNLVVMEYVDGAYIPVVNENTLDAALSMYFER